MRLVSKMRMELSDWRNNSLHYGVEGYSPLTAQSRSDRVP